MDKTSPLSHPTAIRPRKSFSFLHPFRSQSDPITHQSRFHFRLLIWTSNWNTRTILHPHIISFWPPHHPWCDFSPLYIFDWIALWWSSLIALHNLTTIFSTLIFFDQVSQSIVSDIIDWWLRIRASIILRTNF
jgi:hypothetical protein